MKYIQSNKVHTYSVILEDYTLDYDVILDNLIFNLNVSVLNPIKISLFKGLKKKEYEDFELSFEKLKNLFDSKRYSFIRKVFFIDIVEEDFGIRLAAGEMFISSFDKNLSFALCKLLTHKTESVYEIIENDNERYCGEIKNGMKNGIGYCVFDDQTKKMGVWKNDKLNGPGIIEFFNVDRLSDFNHYPYYFAYGSNTKIICGNFKNGLLNGKGSVYFLEEIDESGKEKFKKFKYIGDFQNDKFYGKGDLYFPKEIELADDDAPWPFFRSLDNVCHCSGSFKNDLLKEGFVLDLTKKLEGGFDEDCSSDNTKLLLKGFGVKAVTISEKKFTSFIDDDPCLVEGLDLSDDDAYNVFEKIYYGEWGNTDYGLGQFISGAIEFTNLGLFFGDLNRGEIKNSEGSAIITNTSYTNLEFGTVITGVFNGIKHSKGQVLKINTDGSEETGYWQNGFFYTY